MNNKITSQPKYKVLSLDELNKIEELKRSETDTTYIVEYNGAFVTVFKDGSSIILPPVLGGNEGLLFDDVGEMKKMIESRIFPVKGNNSFWENERNRVLNFPDSISYYCSKLTKMLNYKVELTHDKVYLKELSKVITDKYKTTSDKRNLRNYVSIYVGELLRQRVNGRWRLAKEMSLNVYFIPEITKGDTYCDHWNFVIGELEMASFIPFDIENLIERASTMFHPIRGRRYLDE